VRHASAAVEREEGREMEASAGLAQWANHACGSGANARLEIWEQADGSPCALLVATKKIRGRAPVLVDYDCACGRERVTASVKELRLTGLGIGG
jgi:hypothetical protein